VWYTVVVDELVAWDAVPGTPGAELYGTGLTEVADGTGVSLWVKETGQTVV
jgi:hypothetical protein